MLAPEILPIVSTTFWMSVFSNENVVVGGFDGAPDAVSAIEAGELAYTVLQPVAVYAEEAVRLADEFIRRKLAEFEADIKMNAGLPAGNR